MNPIEILVFETRNGFFKARVRWMERGKECRGYTSNYASMHDTLCAAHKDWQAGFLYTHRSGEPSRFCGKGVPS